MKPNRFRFRAWDRTRGVMLPEKGFHDYNYAVSFGGAICEGYIDGNMASLDEDNFAIILMQSTGLCDSKGVEIFEGDIVKESYINSGGYEYIVTHPYVVEWGETCCDGCLEGVGFDIHAISQENLVVIGNIYQNKDLLEG